VTYQLGNLLAAINLPLQTRLADHYNYNQNFGLGMAIVIVPVLILTALVTWLGPENRGAQLGEISAPEGRRPAAAPLANPASPRSP
jgi:MFS transporter, SHS family, lactate transporter